MRFLLDTNALLWTLAGSHRIEPVREIILADDTDIFVSAVSWWEIAIKTRIGKLDVNLVELRKAARDSGMVELSLSGDHIDPLLTLPKYHNDPFDHMILAQAMVEPLRLITGDRIMKRYLPSVLLI
ncbi:MAG: type II toxin-antitoxin system VapC family toxin [Planctomycetes bacterium]|nr:type II toxin-antitoxin system VapC family toxin [Planctomycetota bacterium]